MRRFWASLAVQLGKRAGLVSVIGLLVTLILGFGITKLHFATGQDAYLNGSDQVYKDNVKYQNLFGGQAMVVLFSMDKGKRVEDLFSPKNNAQMRAATAEVRKSKEVRAVISPITALQFTDNLVQRSFADPKSPTPATDPTATIAGQILLKTINREAPGSPAQQVRQADFNKTASRLLTVKGPKVLSNPEWVKFLIYDNRRPIRKPLRPFFSDSTHAQMVVRLIGNASIEDEGKGAVAVQGRVGRPHHGRSDRSPSPAPPCC